MRTEPFVLFEVLLLSFFLGSGLGFGHDLLLFLSDVLVNIRAKPHKSNHVLHSASQILRDLLFCFAAGGALTVILFYYNEGRPRGFAVIALIFGFFVYRNSFGRLLKAFSAHFSIKLGHGIYHVFSCLTTPIIRLLILLFRLATKPIQFCKKKIVERRIQKYNDMRLEQLRNISKKGFVNI